MSSTDKSTDRQPPSREAWHQFFRDISPDSHADLVNLLGQMRVIMYGIHRKAEQSLDESGLSEAQFRILMHLLFSERMEDTPALNPSQFSRREGTNRNTISSLIRNLEKAQLVIRDINQNDRRKFNIRLSDTGRALVLKHAHTHFYQMSELFSILSEEERQDFGRILQKLNNHINPWES